MRVCEFVTVDEDMPDSGFINNQIDQKAWVKKGEGATASVWQHINDPDTVVKVTGGGYNSGHDFNTNVTMAFVHFCVDNGWKSKHYPIIHGINTDDPDIVQVRIEALRPVNNQIGWALYQLATEVSYGSVADSGWQIKHTDEIFKANNVNRVNSAQKIAEAIELLTKMAPTYCHKHKLKRIRIDLHEDNWMQRADGTLVAIDPWHGD